MQNRRSSALIGICFTALAVHARAQSKFEIADVHPSPHTTSPYMRGPFIRAGRYELRNATMVDLIRTAWSIDEDKVIGGPAWLETDRFDISAKLPPDPTPENLKQALQPLLAERFKLLVHHDTRPIQAWALTAGKKPQLKESDGSGEPGCKNANQVGRGGGRATFTFAGGPPPMTVFSCHAESMNAFAKAMTTGMGMVSVQLNGDPVIDQTGLESTYDFDIKISPLRLGAPGDAENVTIFDAVDKQLGLRLQLQKIPQPVIVVDSVNEKPTGNPPGLTQALPPSPPAEFEVADIKPSDPATPGIRVFNIQPGGRVNLQGVTMKMLVTTAWSLNAAGNFSDSIAGAPKWFDTDRFDIVAKLSSGPPPAGANAANVDDDAVWLAMRALLADRFKLATHYEEQPVAVYALVASKPKLTKADPSNRASCKMPNIIKALTATGPGGTIPGETISCQNTTMARLAELLQQVSMNDVDHPIVDATGLDGTWDFALTWSPAILSRIASDRAKTEPPAGDTAATDPGGGLTMRQALEKQLGLRLELQKRPMPVLVIDHVEQKPTEN